MNNPIIEQFLYGSHNQQIAAKRNQIMALKKEFEVTDYQTMKNLQYEKMGRELPYKWEDIDAKAQSLRDKINLLEKEIDNLLQLQYTKSTTSMEETTKKIFSKN